MISYISELRHIYLFLEEIMCSYCIWTLENNKNFLADLSNCVLATWNILKDPLTINTMKLSAIRQMKRRQERICLDITQSFSSVCWEVYVWFKIKIDFPSNSHERLRIETRRTEIIKKRNRFSREEKLYLITYFQRQYLTCCLTQNSLHPS